MPRAARFTTSAPIVRGDAVATWGFPKPSAGLPRPSLLFDGRRTRLRRLRDPIPQSGQRRALFSPADPAIPRRSGSPEDNPDLRRFRSYALQPHRGHPRLKTEISKHPS
ncbi:hypothetical protein GN956_G9804 [Arapaima gigas]